MADHTAFFMLGELVEYITSGPVVAIEVEDDGIGINKQVYGSPGEHIGLSIMRERASRLGGKLQVESEPGEGTRIVLELNQPASANNLT